MDYLVNDPDIDRHRIAALGHSRNGKTALLAAAFDERIAMAFPHQAGCGGTAPSRGKVGESVKAINTAFPHWFNGEFKKFNEEPERLPFDQNCPVLSSAAQEDQWANPAGQFEVLKAANPVYRFLGTEGLTITQMPPHGKLVASSPTTAGGFSPFCVDLIHRIRYNEFVTHACSSRPLSQRGGFGISSSRAVGW